MTDEIDLDELDVATDEEADEGPNAGDWFWKGDGDPDDEPDPVPATPVAGTSDPADGEQPGAAESPDDSSGGAADSDGESSAKGSSAETRVPHVPRENKDKPVGIPVDQGGAGGTTAAEQTGGGAEPAHPDGDDEAVAASGPHGGGIDDMTLALTYDAVKRFADPQAVIREAAAWADWIGIVGDVETYVISSFQRTHGVDVDFFSGSGQAPAERLATIDTHSMFYAERMVVVGPPDAEAIADAAGWEFVPLATAAEKAGWELTDEDDA